MADEEPKTPISPSGLYNTSSISNVFADYHYYSDYTLEGLSEFTMMAWVRFTGGSNAMYIDYGFYDKIGSISTGFFSFQGSSGTNRIDFSIPTSAGTSLNVFKINSNLTINTWYHLAVTGSLTDNELKLFKDGQVIATSVMPYSIAQPWNNSGTNRSRTSGAVPFYMSQKNVYNRRLTEAEILEHYVYDDDTMSSGVLGFDAMTIAQKSGLIYSSSFTEDISIAGNEFTDKSGNNISISPQPSLTGDQIYVYTDASDLPSDTTIYPLSAMNTTGAGSVWTDDSSFDMSALKTSGMSISIFIDTTSAPTTYLANFSSDSADGTPVELALKIQGGTSYFTVEGYNGAGFDTISTNTNVGGGGLTHVGLTLNAGGSVATLYIDGVSITTGNLSNLNVSSTGRLVIGEGQFGNLYFPTNGLKAMPRVTNREITASEMLYFAQNPSICHADIDNTAGLKDATIYAPTLGEYNGSVAQALVDPASGIITNQTGTVTYNGTGLSVECSN